MLSPRWRKVLQDLWGNKTRTVLVVLSIAVGVFAVGMIAASNVIISRDLRQSYAATNPANALIYPAPFEDDLVRAIERMPEVEAAEGRSGVMVRLKVGPDEWRNMQLFAIPNYEDIRISKVRPEAGAWPPPRNELLLERSSTGVARANIGDTITVETPSGKERQLRVAGLAHDINQFPSLLSGTAYGYVTPETLEWLGFSRRYQELHIVVSGNKQSERHIRQVTEVVRNKIENSGRNVYWTWVPQPGRHPAEDFLNPMVMLLGIIGLLSLFLSGFLVINTISAVMTQQIRQIGIMKAIGARPAQIAGMYFGLVLALSLFSLALGIPLGVLGARLFSSFAASLVNFDIVSFAIPGWVFLLQITVGVIVPFLAALYPIISGTRTTVREAIGSYGLTNGGFGTGRIDRLVNRVRCLSRPLLLSLRNTFRRKGRLALTLITLTLGGIIFIAVFSVHSSLLYTLDEALKYWNFDVELRFNRSYRIEQIQQEVLRVPGVVAAESWGYNTGRRQRADGSCPKMRMPSSSTPTSSRMKLTSRLETKSSSKWKDGTQPGG